MLDYRRELFLGVTRIQSVFVGPRRVGTGTGFWIRLASGQACFVTNRHNLDPSLNFPDQPDLHLETASIELRRSYGIDEGEPSYDSETRYFELDETQSKIFALDNADCAVVMPKFKESTEGFSICAPFDESDLADEDFFQTTLMPIHEVYFIGFPGRGAYFQLGKTEIPWWDTKWNLPITRSAVVASMPFLQFHNERIKTGDVLLVSGMSFKSSSGSPVISKQIGFRVTPPLKCDYIPEKLVGIMSGHWWAGNDDSGNPIHGGLSYFTRSPSILHLIRSNGL
jgi:hypothetical protein